MSRTKKACILCNPEFLKNNHYVECESELIRLIKEILSKTSVKNLESKKIKVIDFTESSKKADRTDIKVSLDKNSKLTTILILLRSYSEFWEITINPNKYIWENTDIFFSEIKEAADAICKEENENLPLPGDEKKIPTPPPDTNAGREDSGPAAVNSSIKPRKKRIVTSSIITDEEILKIFLSWMKHTGGVQRISQREFREVISKLGITIAVQMLVNFLFKKGLVSVISANRKPIIEIASAGIDILKEHERKLELERQKEEDARLLQEKLDFAKDSLSVLRVVENQQTISARLKEVRIAEKTIIQKLTALQKELAEQTERLSTVREARLTYLEKLENSTSPVDWNEVKRLTRIAEN